MKNRGILIILIFITIITVGCGDEFKRAEKLHQRAILENPTRESYEELIQLYREKDEMEKLTKTVEAAIGHGYPPVENEIYLKILQYYDSIGEKDKLAHLMADTFSGISLPISIYKEFLLKDKLAKDMDLIEMKCGDLTGDGKNEILVLMAQPQEEINMNYYEKFKLEVYNLQGHIIYEDGQEGGYFLYPKTALVDLSQDGVKDLYYNVIYDSITNANTMAKVVDFKDGDIDLIYSDGIDQIDIEIKITSNDSYTIYSRVMDRSYDIVLEEGHEELELDPIWWEVYEKIAKDEKGKEIIQTNFEIKGYGMIQVNYAYVEGRIIPVDFTIEAISREQ